MDFSGIKNDSNQPQPSINQSTPPPTEENLPNTVPDVSSSSTTEEVSTEAKKSDVEMKLIKSFIQRSGCYVEGDGQYTLQQWLYLQFLKLMKGNPLSLSRFNWIDRIGSCLDKKIDSNHGVRDLFGMVPKEQPLKNKVGALCFLARKHDYFSMTFAELFGSSKKENVESIIELHRTGIEAVASLYEESLERLEKKTKNGRRFIEQLFGRNVRGRRGRVLLQNKIQGLDVFVDLERKVAAFKRLYHLRMGYIRRIFVQLSEKRKDLRNSKFLILELASAIGQFEKAMKHITFSLKTVVNKQVDTVPLKIEEKLKIKNSVQPLSDLKLISDERKTENLLDALEEYKNQYAQIQKLMLMLKKFEEESDTEKGSFKEDYEDLREGAEVCKQLIKSTENIGGLRKTLVKEGHKWDEAVATVKRKIIPFFGGEKNVDDLAKQSYQTLIEIKQLLDVCAESGLSLFRFAKEDLRRCSSTIPLNKEKVENSWLELLESEMASRPKKRKKKVPSKQTTTTTTTTTPQTKQKESELTIETLESPPKIWTKEELSLQEGRIRLDRLKKDPKSLPSFVAVSDWMSSLLPKSLPSLDQLDSGQKNRVYTAQLEAQDHVFLSACGTEVFLESYRKGDVLSALSAVRTLLIHWHVQIEQTLFAEYTLKNRVVPDHHHLVYLAKESGLWDSSSTEEQALLKELELALLWARYPESYLERYVKPPMALYWLNQANSWIASIQKGEKNQKMIEEFPKLLDWVYQTQVRVQNWVLGRLKQRKKEWNSLLQETGSVCQKALEGHASESKKVQLVPSTAKKDDQLSFANQTGPYTVHLKEVEGHLRHLFAVGQVSLVHPHRLAWKESALAQIQWAGEEAYRFVCLKRGLGQVLTHNFSVFESHLSDQAKIEGKGMVKAGLQFYHFGIGAHYSRSRKFSMQKAYLTCLTQCRNDLAWDGVKKREEKRFLPRGYQQILKKGVPLIFKFLKKEG